MKTIVLMGVSCLLLAGVYGVMNKESEVSKILSFNQANGAGSPIDAGDKDKANNRLTTDSSDHKASSSNTLDDSHWIDGPLFEKAPGSDLITDNEVDVPQASANPENIKQAAPRRGIDRPVIEPKTAIKQLILKLDEEDTTTQKKVPVEVI